ncbi:hypothetical protein GCM10022212_24330 [Actimicrobium antarcticum]|uniref:Diguanylate cyclase (GGDEF) domain-containing protein n=1 Tax=Actimicrobium antarcticum TaxID=1051899 RepID=A0ABP7TFJ8_9BURK
MIAALIPTLLLGLLTYRSINAGLQQQQHTELVEVSRSYAQAVAGRLGFAHAALAALAQDDSAVPSPTSSRYPMFQSIDRIPLREPASERDVSTRVKPDAAPHSALRLALLAVQPSRGTGQAAIVSLIAVSPSPSTALKAPLRTEYLWGDGDEISAAYSLCVYASGNAPLFCNVPTAPAQHLRDASAARTGSFELFLKPAFHVAPWTIVASRRFPASGGAFADFFMVYLTVAVSSVLLILLLSLVQIRRVLGPLERLTAGARRIATGDFSPVAVSTDDEFGKLAVAVNDMSNQIGRQLTTLQTLAAIDQNMLTRLDLQSVIRMVDARIRLLLPHAALHVARQVADRQGAGILYSRSSDETVTSEDTVDVDPCHQDLAQIAISATGLCNPPLTRLTDGNSSWTTALMWQGASRGILSLTWPGPSVLNADTVDELTKLANRIAVAIQLEEREQHLRYQALYDSLTGLLNRSGLEEKILSLMAGRSAGVVLFIDIDRFKQINDNFGHKTGDLVLKEVGQRLRVAVGAGVAGRLAGDEFVLIVDDSDATSVAAFALQVMQSLTRPCEVGTQQFQLTCSIGIALHPSTIDDGLTLLERADVAMYRAKQSGRNAYRIYNAAMTTENHQRQALESDLRQALKEGQFFLHYQPKVNLVTGAIEGAEALVRWLHPVRGLVSPLQFIGLAEEIGLIVPLGAWIMRTACLQNAAWRRAGLKPVRIAVNVAARQFAEPGFVESVAAILHETGLPADGLEIELTEGTMMSEGEQMIDQLTKLRNLGILLAIDDFGTGYSSLAYLKRYPVSVLKIDQSFVRDLAANRDDQLIVTAIIGIAHNLQLQVVAEGVETLAQLDYLKAQGCDVYQGYYCSKPVMPAAFMAMLEDQKHRSV